YTDAAAASFKTSIDAISSGFKVFNGFVDTVCDVAVVLTTTPSNTYKGALPAEIDPTPLIRTVIPAPGTPTDDWTFTPAILPCMAPSILVVMAPLTASAFRVEMDPVTSLFACVV